MEHIFTEKDILYAIKYAIRELNKNDSLLLNIHCSERSQVHWLAIYFDKKIRENYRNNTSSPDMPEDYKVDVEYNRVGSIPDNTKQIRNLCDRCPWESELKKCKKKRTDNVTVDMVFHRRGINDVDSNFFCLEVKPSHNKASKCDCQRIYNLVLNSKIGSKPIYQYGLALHLLEKDEQDGANPLLADGTFYINNSDRFQGEDEPIEKGFKCYKFD